MVTRCVLCEVPDEAEERVYSTKHDCIFDSKISLFTSYGCMLLGKPRRHVQDVYDSMRLFICKHTEHYNDCQHWPNNVAWSIYAFCIIIPMDNIVFPYSKQNA
jgi:hypothetical protein